VLELHVNNRVHGRELALRAVAEARAAGDTRTAARAMRTVAWALNDANTAGRVALLEEALALARADGGVGHVATHLAWLALAVADAGDRVRVRELAEEADELAREAGDSWKRVIPNIELGCGSRLRRTDWMTRSCPSRRRSTWGQSSAASGVYSAFLGSDR
jgi:hypothetical protein